MLQIPAVVVVVSRFEFETDVLLPLWLPTSAYP